MSGYLRRGVAHDPRHPTEFVERHVRSKFSLPVFASLVCLALVVAAGVAPQQRSLARALEAPRVGDTQVAVLAEDATHVASARDEFGVSRIPTVPVFRVPAAGVPDPGTAKAIAYDMVLARGWGMSEYECLVALWNRESGWNVYAHNRSSGAYGIPQALPGDKMATVADDWRTNPVTQITWGLRYIEGRYGTPCGAWQSSETRGWY